MKAVSVSAFVLAWTASLLACGSERSGAASDTAAVTCSELARQYMESLEADAKLCTLGDDATCTGRRPNGGMAVDGDVVVSYFLVQCPQEGRGTPVNPARVEQLDGLMEAYREECGLFAAPGCGVPGWTPRAATCAVDDDGVARCRIPSPE